MATAFIDDFKTYTNNHFDFSTFQNDACKAIIDNKHVLVTAHTGSGKTLPAEFSIYYNIKQLNKKVIYTSPIKALSNQKFQEFSKKFHDVEVGILTGDIKHNPGADLLIMTTEILQNHCFKSNHEGNEEFLDFSMDIENELGSVIFDEVHYIDDPDRGTVWEQSMIMLPNHIPFVMLSATIGQKERFANWIETITNKQVVVCSTSERVVPLEFYEYFTVPEKYVENIKDKKQKQMFRNKIEHPWTIIKNTERIYHSVLASTKRCHHFLEKDNFRVHTKYVLNECANMLKQQDLFPCLIFVFSRKQVEHLAQQITTNLFLENEKDYQVEPVFRQLLVSKVSNWKEYKSLPEYEFYLNLLEKGIGIHHAGMLPVFKEMIEILYDRKYIKILVATETFAIGLNMPTRTVIFSSIYKHDGVTKRLLKSHEFTQMAGRAGRRNIDTKGYVILLTNNFDPPDEAQYTALFQSTPKVLQSRFKINYNLILNFINNKSRNELISMIEQSMMNSDIKGQIEHSINKICEIEKDIEIYENKSRKIDADFETFFQGYFDMVQKVNRSKNKERRRLNNQLCEFKERNKLMLQYEELYLHGMELKEKHRDENKMKLYAESFIKDRVDGIINILLVNGFIENTEDNNIKLTSWGTHASYIHELPCLAFIDVYNEFMSTSCNEVRSLNNAEKAILCILSCFYPLKISDDEKQHDPDKLKRELSYIQDRLNHYHDQEIKVEIYVTDPHCLQYDLMHWFEYWYENIKTQEDALHFFHRMKTESSIFVGDFLKACLKIINMINELRIICKQDDNHILLQTLDNIQRELQKNIVSNASLYL
jgi:superfamily II RNA helicase